MIDNTNTKLYICIDGQKHECTPATIGYGINPSEIKSGRGRSLSGYESLSSLSKKGIELSLDNVTISPDFVKWLEEGRKAQEHKNRLERLCYNKITCETEGHDWDLYEVSTGYSSNDIEQAGVCKRCGFDTHAYLEEDSHEES